MGMKAGVSVIGFLFSFVLSSLAGAISFQRYQVTSDQVNNKNFAQVDRGIALDKNGKVHLTYWGIDTTVSFFKAIFYATNDTLSGWKIQKITANFYDDYNPTLAVDSNNAVHLVWVKDSEPDVVVYSNDSSGNWSSPLPVFPTLQNGASSPSIDMNGTPELHIAFRSNGDATSNSAGIYYFTFNVLVNGDFPSMEVGNNGIGYLACVWYENEGSNLDTEVVYTRFAGPKLNLSNTAYNEGTEVEPSIAVDDSNIVHIIYKRAGPDSLIYFKIRNDSIIYREAPLTNIVEPSLAIDKNFKAHLSFSRNAVTFNQIFYTDNTSGSWMTPLRITSDLDDNGTYSHIAVDSKNRAHIAYVGNTLNDPQIFVAVSYISGDVNSDGRISPADIVFLINYYFKSGTLPYPLNSGDVTCNGSISPSDIVYLINYYFKSGPVPPDPCIQ